MELRGERIYAYGVWIEPGSFECVDCGHRYEHSLQAPLPPCPGYRDSTHTRAAWRNQREAAFPTAEPR
jgi:hypothetical protein